LNKAGHIGWMRGSLAAAIVLTVLGSMAGLYGPWSHDMDPTAHVYPAIVWVLVVWTLAHAAIGAVMQFYCLAGSFAGRLTQAHDIDIHNVALYWHFMLVTAFTTFMVVGLFPLAV
jgi:cytochrome c oxidase subunit I+III